MICTTMLKHKTSAVPWTSSNKTSNSVNTSKMYEIPNPSMQMPRVIRLKRSTDRGWVFTRAWGIRNIRISTQLQQKLSKCDFYSPRSHCILVLC